MESANKLWQIFIFTLVFSITLLLIGYYLFPASLFVKVVWVITLLSAGTLMGVYAYLNFDALTHPKAAQHFRNGFLFQRQQKFDEAIEQYNMALNLRSRYTAAAINRGICLIQKQEWDAANAEFNRIIQLKQRDKWKYLAYYWHGHLAATKYDYDVAVSDYTQALKLNSKYAPAYIDRSIVYIRLRRYEEATADDYRAIHLTRKKNVASLAYNNQAYAYALLGNLPKSLEKVTHAISLDAKSIYAYGTRGHTYYLMGKYPEALADFQQALALKPDHKFAIAGAALTQQALGDMDEAKRLWRSLIEMDEKYREADAVQQEYDCADAWVEAARRLLAAL